jgi:hypothetical protein
MLPKTKPNVGNLIEEVASSGKQSSWMEEEPANTVSTSGPKGGREKTW